MAEIIVKNYAKASVMTYADGIAIYSCIMNDTKALKRSEQTCNIIQNE